MMTGNSPAPSSQPSGGRLPAPAKLPKAVEEKLAAAKDPGASTSTTEAASPDTSKKTILDTPRKPRAVDHLGEDVLPTYFGFPVGISAPLRVLVQGRVKRCKQKSDGFRCVKQAGHDGICVCDGSVANDPYMRDAEGVPLKGPIQNFWVGLNGLDVQVMEGGYDENGEPLGIPGHSQPIVAIMYGLTEYRRERYRLTDKGRRRVDMGSWSDSRGVWQGCYLPVLLERMGFGGNWRGMGDKPKRALHRLRQLCETRHRIISVRCSEHANDAEPPFRCNRCREHAVALYDHLHAAGSAPPAGEIPGWMLIRGATGPDPAWPSPMLPERSPFKIAADYQIWDASGLGETRTGFEAWIELSADFIARTGQSAPLLPRELVVRLVRHPQRLMLAGLVSRHINLMLATGRTEQYLGSAYSLMDQIGQNGAQEHRRPHHATEAMREMARQWRLAAMEMDIPDAIFEYEEVMVKGEIGIMLYCPAKRFIELSAERK